MSWLSMQLGLSYDWSEAVMLAREKQTEWLASLVEEQRMKHRSLPIVVLGTAYKPECNLDDGSCAILLKNILEIKGYPNITTFDPYINKDRTAPLDAPAIFFIGTKHPEFQHYAFPSGSVVIDPWRYIPNHRTNIEIIAVGKPAEKVIAVDQ